MKFDLEWFKKHKAAAGGAVLVGLLVLFFLFRRSGSSAGSDVASLAANQQSAQLQLAQLNAQESSQQNQLNAQLAASEFSTSAQEQQSQDQLAASLAGSLVPMQIQTAFESPIYAEELALYGEEITGQQSQQAALLPLEQEAQTLSRSGNNNTAALGENELALLLGEGVNYQNKYGSQTFLPTGSSSPLQIPFGLPQQIGQGLFA